MRSLHASASSVQPRFRVLPFAPLDGGPKRWEVVDTHFGDGWSWEAGAVVRAYDDATTAHGLAALLNEAEPIDVDAADLDSWAHRADRRDDEHHDQDAVMGCGLTEYDCTLDHGEPFRLGNPEPEWKVVQDHLRASRGSSRVDPEDEARMLYGWAR